jgi:plastocyanin domain-containing protein
MNTTILVAIMGLLVVGGVFMLFSASAIVNTTNDNEPTPPESITFPPIVEGKQDVFLKATQYGTYSPSRLYVKKGIPVRIHYSADQYAGCGREVIFPEYKIRKLAPSQGEALIEFTPTTSGKFPFHCSMKMFNGTIEVIG